MTHRVSSKETVFIFVAVYTVTISDTVKAVKSLSEKFDDLTDRDWQTGRDRYNEEEKKNIKEEKPVVKQITDDDKIDKSNKRKMIIISSIIGVLALIFVAVVIVFPKITASKDVEIPDVYGMEISKAEEMIKKAGFKSLGNRDLLSKKEDL